MPRSAFYGDFLPEIFAGNHYFGTGEVARPPVFHATNRGPNVGITLRSMQHAQVTRDRLSPRICWAIAEPDRKANPKNLSREHCVQHPTVQFRMDAAATPFSTPGAGGNPSARLILIGVPRRCQSPDLTRCAATPHVQRAGTDFDNLPAGRLRVPRLGQMGGNGNTAHRRHASEQAAFRTTAANYARPGPERRLANCFRSQRTCAAMAWRRPLGCPLTRLLSSISTSCRRPANQGR
jgi:hypothetical protein